MKKIYTYLLVLLLLVSSFIVIEKDELTDIQLQTSQTIFNANEDIVLTFSSSLLSSAPNLYFSNSYGSSVLMPTRKGDLLTYDLTKVLNHKTGFVNWSLIFDENTIVDGSLTVIPDKKITKIESYLGPNTIQAGEKDFAMMVILLHDRYDNPAADSTKTIFKSQYLNDESSFLMNSSNLISYQNFYAKKEIGRILVSSETDTTYSKEYTIDVLPNIPTDFTISVKRNHDYADGNQITRFITSIMRDKYQNIVSDGTYVEFFIKNINNNVLKMSGTTVRGIAEASMIHPDHAENWKVKAYVPGMAESNEVTVVYKSAIEEFKLSFNKETNVLNVLELKSFMKQFIPDGQRITLKIFKNNNQINTVYETSKEGRATFLLEDHIISKGTYSFEVDVAGVSKVLQYNKL